MRQQSRETATGRLTRELDWQITDSAPTSDSQGGTPRAPISSIPPAVLSTVPAIVCFHISFGLPQTARIIPKL